MKADVRQKTKCAAEGLSLSHFFPPFSHQNSSSEFSVALNGGSGVVEITNRNERSQIRVQLHKQASHQEKAVVVLYCAHVRNEGMNKFMKLRKIIKRDIR